MPRKLKITVLKTLDPSELFEEMPVVRMDWMVPCEVFNEGKEFIIKNIEMPKGFCASAWRAINHNVRTLFYGGVLPHHEEGDVAVNCCTDGLRPVIFKIERI